MRLKEKFAGEQGDLWGRIEIKTLGRSFLLLPLFLPIWDMGARMLGVVVFGVVVAIL